MMSSYMSKAQGWFNFSVHDPIKMILRQHNQEAPQVYLLLYSFTQNYVSAFVFVACVVRDHCKEHYGDQLNFGWLAFKMTRRFKSLKIWSTFILLHKSCPIRDTDLCTAHIWSNINFQDKSPCPLYLVQLYHKCLSQFSLLGLCSSLKATVAAEMGL